MIIARILVLESSITDYENLNKQLSSFGYSSASFLQITNLGEINSKQINDFSPEVIFLTIENEDDDLFVEYYLDAQSLFPLIPFIIFSNRDDDELAVKCVHAGAQSYMTKGMFTASQLYRVLCFSRERNVLRQELKRLKEDYLNIFENSVPMLVADKKTRLLISANKAAIELYGYSQQEFSNIRLEDLRNSSNFKTLNFITPLVENRCVIHYTKNGDRLYLEITETPLTYNKVSSLLIGINNITSKILTEYEQRATTQRLDAIFNETHDLIFLVNDERKFVQVNKSATKILGYNEKELLEMCAEDIYDSSLDSTDSVNDLWTAFLVNGTHKGVVKVRTKNGEIIICSHTATANILNGLHLSVLTDITLNEQNLKKIEKQAYKIESILDNISDCFFTIDKNYLITYWNKAAEKTTSILKEKVLGKNIWKIFEPAKKTSIYKNYQNAIASGVSVHFEEYYEPFNMWYRISAYPTDEGLAVFFCDITSEKKHSLEIQEARNNQSALINSCKHLIWSVDNEMKLLSFNNAYASRILQVTGNSAKEGMQLPIHFYNEDQTQKWRQYYKRALSGEVFTIEEVISDHKTAKNKIAEITFNPFYEISTGKIKGVACYSHDITMREEQNIKIKANEQNLEKLTRKLEKIMNSSLDVICSIDSRGRFLQVSNASIYVWGYYPEELVGKYSLNFFTNKTHYTSKKAALNIIRGAVYTDFQNAFIHKNGHHVPLIWSARWDKDEHIMFCVARDAYALQEAENLKSKTEQRITALVQNGTDIIGILDAFANYIYISPNVKNLMGYDPQLLLKSNAWDFIHPDDLEYTMGEMQKVLIEGEVKLAAFRYKNGWGEWRWLETVASNQLQNAAIQGIVISSRDITTRKQIEAERELMIKELLKSNADLKQFSFITSHNLRAPLSNIVGILNIIEYEQLDEYNKNMLAMLGKSVSQLGQTINDLSTILIVKNNVNIEIEEINLKKIFNKVNSVFHNTLNDMCADINLEFKIPHILFNPTYFESILVNLISNSIKYRSPNRTLSIKISTEEDEDGNISLKFSDNGIGIDLKRHKNNLFGLYQRFHDHTEGHGLGLFIIKSQIVALGGKIDLQSEVDKGTTFIITLKRQSNLAIA